MHRAETQARWARRIVPLAAATAIVGAGAFYVTKALRPDDAAAGRSGLQIAPTAPSLPLLATSPGGEGATASSAATNPRGGATGSAPANGAGAHPPNGNAGGAAGAGFGGAPVGAGATGTVPSGGKPGAKTRHLKLETNIPNGVLVAIDGESLGDAGKTFDIDDKAHTVEVSCKGDMCEPQSKPLPAGDKDATLSFTSLKLRDARLRVNGDHAKRYVLVERGKDLPEGQASNIQLSIGQGDFTVRELETGISQPVHLVPNRETSVTFGASP